MDKFPDIVSESFPDDETQIIQDDQTRQGEQTAVADILNLSNSTKSPELVTNTTIKKDSSKSKTKGKGKNKSKGNDIVYHTQQEQEHGQGQGLAQEQDLHSLGINNINHKISDNDAGSIRSESSNTSQQLNDIKPLLYQNIRQAQGQEQEHDNIHDKPSSPLSTLSLSLHQATSEEKVTDSTMVTSPIASSMTNHQNTATTPTIPTVSTPKQSNINPNFPISQRRSVLLKQHAYLETSQSGDYSLSSSQSHLQSYSHSQSHSHSQSALLSQSTHSPILNQQKYTNSSSRTNQTNATNTTNTSNIKNTPKKSELRGLRLHTPLATSRDIANPHDYSFFTKVATPVGGGAASISTLSIDFSASTDGLLALDNSSQQQGSSVNPVNSVNPAHSTDSTNNNNNNDNNNDKIHNTTTDTTSASNTTTSTTPKEVPPEEAHLDYSVMIGYKDTWMKFLRHLLTCMVFSVFYALFWAWFPDIWARYRYQTTPTLRNAEYVHIRDKQGRWTLVDIERIGSVAEYETTSDVYKTHTSLDEFDQDGYYIGQDYDTIDVLEGTELALYRDDEFLRDSHDYIFDIPTNGVANGGSNNHTNQTSLLDELLDVPDEELSRSERNQRRKYRKMIEKRRQQRLNALEKDVLARRKVQNKTGSNINTSINTDTDTNTDTDIDTNVTIPYHHRMIIYRNRRFLYDTKSDSFILLQCPSTYTVADLKDASLGAGFITAEYATEKRLYGLNMLYIPVPSIPKLLVEEVLHPFFVFQLYSVILWCFEQYVVFATVIGCMAIASTAITVYDARQSIYKLQELARTNSTVSVIRDGTVRIVDANNLVPGDLVELTECIDIPCDLTLLTGSVVVNESMLTGESVPVVKYPILDTVDVADVVGVVSVGDIVDVVNIDNDTTMLDIIGTPTTPIVPGLHSRTMYDNDKVNANMNMNVNDHTSPPPFVYHKDMSEKLEVGKDPRTTLFAGSCIMQLKHPLATTGVVASSSGSNATSTNNTTTDEQTQAQGPIYALVVRTGFSTTKGNMISSMLYPPKSSFKFEQQSYRFVGVLFILAIIGCIIAFWKYYMLGAPQSTIILRALDLITIVVPPSLPLAMSIGTNFSIVCLRKLRIFCIAPSRVNFAGKIKLMCFDKTGTLTSDSLQFKGVHTFVPSDTSVLVKGSNLSSTSVRVSTVDGESKGIKMSLKKSTTGVGVGVGVGAGAGAGVSTAIGYNPDQTHVHTNTLSSPSFGISMQKLEKENENKYDDGSKNANTTNVTNVTNTASTTVNTFSGDKSILHPSIRACLATCHSLAAYEGGFLGDPLEIEGYTAATALFDDSATKGVLFHSRLLKNRLTVKKAYNRADIDAELSKRDSEVSSRGSNRRGSRGSSGSSRRDSRHSSRGSSRRGSRGNRSSKNRKSYRDQNYDNLNNIDTSNANTTATTATAINPSVINTSITLDIGQGELVETRGRNRQNGRHRRMPRKDSYHSVDSNGDRDRSRSRSISRSRSNSRSRSRSNVFTRANKYSSNDDGEHTDYTDYSTSDAHSDSGYDSDSDSSSHRNSYSDYNSNDDCQSDYSDNECLCDCHFYSNYFISGISGDPSTYTHVFCDCNCEEIIANTQIANVNLFASEVAKREAIGSYVPPLSNSIGFQDLHEVNEQVQRVGTGAGAGAGVGARARADGTYEDPEEEKRSGISNSTSTPQLQSQPTHIHQMYTPALEHYYTSTTQQGYVHAKRIVMPLTSPNGTITQTTVTNSHNLHNPISLDFDTTTMNAATITADPMTTKLCGSGSTGRCWAVVKQFPFESQLQRMSVIALNELDGSAHVFAKGAPEMIAKLSDPSTIPHDFAETVDRYTNEGYRVIALATKRYIVKDEYLQHAKELYETQTQAQGQGQGQRLGDDDGEDQNTTTNNNNTHVTALLSSISAVSNHNELRDDVEQGLQLLGLFVLENALKPATIPTLTILKNAKIRSVMVTGDNIKTAVSISRQCGIIEQDCAIFLSQLKKKKKTEEEGEKTVDVDVKVNTSEGEKDKNQDKDKDTKDASTSTSNVSHSTYLPHDIEWVCHTHPEYTLDPYTFEIRPPLNSNSSMTGAQQLAQLGFSKFELAVTGECFSILMNDHNARINALASFQSLGGRSEDFQYEEYILRYLNGTLDEYVMLSKIAANPRRSVEIEREYYAKQKGIESKVGGGSRGGGSIEASTALTNGLSSSHSDHAYITMNSSDDTTINTHTPLEQHAIDVRSSSNSISNTTNNTNTTDVNNTNNTTENPISQAMLAFEYPHIKTLDIVSPLQRIVLGGCVFARMSPDQKASLVSQYQKLGMYTGMCGDGANDCGALKTAHVGVSLAESEASIAAPFTSQISDISCIPLILGEGRSALTTCFQLFKFMALYSFIQFSACICLYFMGGNFCDYQFLYQDLFAVFPLSILMGRTPAGSELTSKRPSGNLLSKLNIASLGLHMITAGSFLVLVYNLVKSQPQYQIFENTNWTCFMWEATSIHYFCCFQYILFALLFSYARPWKKLPIYNIGLTICVIASVVVSFSLFWFGPGEDAIKKWIIFLQDDLWMPNSWKIKMVYLIFAHIVITIFIEFIVIKYIKKLGNNIYASRRTHTIYGKGSNRIDQGAKPYHVIRKEFEMNFPRNYAGIKNKSKNKGMSMSTDANTSIMYDRYKGQAISTTLPSKARSVKSV